MRPIASARTYRGPLTKMSGIVAPRAAENGGEKKLEISTRPINTPTGMPLTRLAKVNTTMINARAASHTSITARRG